MKRIELRCLAGIKALTLKTFSTLSVAEAKNPSQMLVASLMKLTKDLLEAMQARKDKAKRNGQSLTRKCISQNAGTMMISATIFRLICLLTDR